MEDKIKNNSTSRRGFLGGISKWVAGTTALGLLANVFTAKELKGNGPRDSISGYDNWIGEINMVGFNFAPRNWAFCDGQLLPIASNTALFALLGTTYGGDGRTYFGLPDLRGRVAIHPGTGPGLSTRQQGQLGGSENETLSTTQIPAHNHSIAVNSASGNSDSPTGNYLAVNSEGIKQYSTTSDGVAGAIGSSGSGQSHNNMPPFLGIYHVIALQGIFPTRS